MSRKIFLGFLWLTLLAIGILPIAHAGPESAITLKKLKKLSDKKFLTRVEEIKSNAGNDEEGRYDFSHESGRYVIDRLFTFYATLNYQTEWGANAQVDILQLIGWVSDQLIYSIQNSKDKINSTPLPDIKAQKMLSSLFKTKLLDDYTLESLLYHVHNQGFGPDEAGKFLAFSDIGTNALVTHYNALMHWYWQDLYHEQIDEGESESSKFKANEEPLPKPFTPHGRRRFFHKHPKAMAQGDLRAIIATLETYAEYQMWGNFEQMANYITLHIAKAALVGDAFEQQELTRVVFMIHEYQRKHRPSSVPMIGGSSICSGLILKTMSLTAKRSKK